MPRADRAADVLIKYELKTKFPPADTKNAQLPGREPGAAEGRERES